MSQNQIRVNHILDQFNQVQSIKDYKKQLSPLSESEIAALHQNNFATGFGENSVKERQQFLADLGHETSYLSGSKTFNEPEQLKGNVEHFIGMAMVPVGLAGPMLVKGSRANGEYFVPLATTEGALVASYHRGMKACRLSGGITSVCLVEGIQRSPFFKFRNFHTAALFIEWIYAHVQEFKNIVAATTGHGKLLEVGTNVEGNSVILIFEFSTGDASGQNMVTICTDKICAYILENFEHKPLEWYIESNFSGDKKATALSFSHVRGKKVLAEVNVPRSVVEKVLKTTPEQICDYWQSSTLATLQSGSIGAQGHVANGLAAIFIACGQDVACVAESFVGLTRMELNENNDLYVSLTLPSLMVGTVGGGTHLPTQQECLKMLGCTGPGSAKKFAEICCSAALAGELSIASAIAANHFTRAHKYYGRKNNGK